VSRNFRRSVLDLTAYPKITYRKPTPKELPNDIKEDYE